DLTHLNKNRLEALFAVVPELRYQEGVEYVNIRQTACNNEEEARKLFHGLVVTYRPAYTKEQAFREKYMLDRILEGKPIKAIDYHTSPPADTAVADDTGESGDSLVERTYFW